MAEARLGIVIDGGAARRSAEEVAKALDAISAAATRETGAVSQTIASIVRLAQTQQQAQVAATQEINTLQQKIAIQQRVATGALSAAHATRQMAEAEIFARTGSRELAQQLAGLQQQYAQVTRAAQAQTAAHGHVSASLLNIIQIAAGFSLAGLFAAAVSHVRALVTEGIRYNATLEQQRIGIGSIIAATQNIATAQGKTLEGVEKFNVAQQLASGLMKQIQQDALKTTATTEQLVDAFQQAAGPLTAAGLSLDRARQATLLIVQAASALGVPMHQVAQEVRAIAEGSIDINARLAYALGITTEQVKAARAHGQLFEFIVEKTEAFAAAGTATEQSFSGLSSSIADVSSQILGLAAAPVFDALRNAMQGVLNFLTEIRNTLAGDLDSAIANLKKNIEDLQVNLNDRSNWASFQRTMESLNQNFVPANRHLADMKTKLRELEVEWGLQQSVLAQYVTSSNKTKDATDDQTKAHEQFRQSLRGNSAELVLRANVLREAAGQGLSYEEAQRKAAEAVDALKSNDAEAAAQNAALKKTIEDILRPLKDKAEADKEAERASHRAAEKVKQHTEEIIKHRTVLEAQSSVYGLVIKGTLSLEEAEQELAVQQLAVTVGSRAIAEAFLKQKTAAEDLGKAEALRARLDAELVKVRADEATAMAALAIQTKNTATNNTELARIIHQGVTSGRNYDDVLRDVAIRQKEIELTGKVAAESVHELAVAAVDSAAALETEREALDSLKNSGVNITDIFRESIRGLAQGTLSLKDLVKKQGQAIGVSMIEGILFGKRGKEKDILVNFNQLLGIDAAGIFGQEGLNLGNNLISNIFDTVARGGKSLLSAIGLDLWSSAGSSAGLEFGTAAFDAASVVWKSGWEALGNGSGASTGLTPAGGGGGFAVGALGGIVGNFAGRGLANLIGIGQSREGSTGGQIGGIVGGIGGGVLAGSGAGAAIGAALGLGLQALNFILPGVGAILGVLLGSVLGDLFAHIPTKGTQIRKGVINWLDEIGVSFANELSSKKYFFKETKTLAEQLFGGDFLAASKEILETKAEPALANQLKALGTFITADQAKSLGKPVEQTGTTFGNLLVANLGIDAIPDAISEIVQQANLTLESLTAKLNTVFQDNLIGAEFYKEAILGAVDIFDDALPKAINTAGIAMKSFTDDGIFSLTEFQRRVEEATGIFDAIGQSAVAAIQDSQSGEEAADIFAKGLKRRLDELALGAFLKDFIDNKLFEGIDLSDGFGTEEIALLRDRVRAARVEADALVTALHETGDAAVDASTDIAALNRQLDELANRRVQVQVDLARQLGSIGALTPTQVIAVQETPLIPTVNRVLNARGPIGARPFFNFTEEEIQPALDAVAQMADFAVARFHAAEQELNAGLQERIRLINESTQTALDGIRQEYAARRAASQQASQEQIAGLQALLQTAQQFRQVSESVQQTINSLTLSNSPLFGPEKLAFLQRQATELRGVNTADAIQQLSQNLASQLQVGQEFLDPTTFSRLFADVTDELQYVRDTATEQGRRAEDIQRHIEQIQQAQQQHLQALATSENNAIAAVQRAGAAQITAAQAETKAAIDAYRVVIVARLEELAAARDALLREQAARLIQQADLQTEQLNQLVDINANTQAMQEVLSSFLTTIASAAGGFYSPRLPSNQLILAHRNEAVSIGPSGQNGGGSVTFAPVISVTVQGTHDPEQDGTRLGRALSLAMMREYQTGGLGLAIRNDMRRRSA
jgi:hypothetical protein